MVESDAAPTLGFPERGLEGLRDLAGSVTTERGAARLAFGRAVESVLGHRADAADHLEAALAADPGLAAAHLLRGFALRMLGRRDLLPGVREALTAARRSVEERGATARETALLEALEAWLAGRPDLAADRLDRHLAAAPRDPLAIKLVHAIRFMIGDPRGMRRSLEVVLPAFAESTPGFGYVLGCRAFALEETGALAEAESVGRRALEIQPRDVWGLHAVAHVLYESGRSTEGVAWLGGREALLEGVNNFAGHVAWHEALFHVDAGRPGRALDLYDRRVAVYPPRDYRDVSNATSLLLLLEQQGIGVGDRWEALAEIARERAGDHGLSFADLHYALALVGAGHAEEARDLVGSMRRHARREPRDFDARIMREIGAPLAEAVVSALEGEAERALETVARIGLEARRVGGSRAQRRVIAWALRGRGGRSRAQEG